MSIEHDYIRSELRGRFNDLLKRLQEFRQHLKQVQLSSTEALVELQAHLGPALSHVEESIGVVHLQLESFDSTLEADWSQLREATEAEWNRLTDILDDAEHQVRFAEDKAQLPPYLSPRDTLERDYSVSGRI